MLSSGAQHLSYLEEECEGEWIGTGAQMLRLPQQVSAEEFRAIRKGLDPETGEELRCRRVVDRVYHKPWGDEIYRARELYDLTISAPKTVSIQGIVDPRIKEAHGESVRALLPSLEERCGTMVVAAFEHTDSRKHSARQRTVP